MTLIPTLNIGASGIRAFTQKTEVIGDNIANVDTVGHKAGRVDFQSLFSNTISFGTSPQGNIGGINPVQTGVGVEVGTVQRLNTQGTLKATGLNSDMAIQGNGFFVMNDLLGQSTFSRSGVFGLNGVNQLINPANGSFVQGLQADQDFNIIQGGGLSNILVDIGVLSIAKATTVSEMRGNFNGAGDVSSQGTRLLSEQLFDAAKDVANNNDGVADATEEADEATLLTNLRRSIGGNLVSAGIANGTEIQIDAQKNGKTLPTASFLVGDPPPNGGTTVRELLIFMRQSLGIDVGAAVGGAQNVGHPSFQRLSLVDGLGVDGTIDATDAFVAAIAAGTDQLTDDEVDFEAAGVRIGDVVRFSSGNSSGELARITAVGLANGLANDNTIQFTSIDPGRPAQLLDTYAIHVPAGAVAAGDLGGVRINNDAAAGAAGVDNFGANQASHDDVADGVIEVAGNISESNDIRGLTISIDGTNFPIFSGAGSVAATGESVQTSFTVFDSLGIPHLTEMTFAFQGANDRGNRWRWFAESTSNSGPNRNVGTGTIDFDTNGRFVSVPAGETIAIDLGSTGSETPLVFTPEFSRLTQFDQTSETELFQQDGFEQGTLNDFSVDRDGTIQGSFTNGLIRSLAQIQLASFANVNGLEAVGANQFVVGVNSGDAQIGQAGLFGRGTIENGFVEESNVDLAVEFTELISAQRAFQANARTITTANEMLQELVNLV